MAEKRERREDSLLLSREQLRELDHCQARVVELERELAACGDEFLSILNRHYFNRENGYLEDQRQNLREVTLLKGRLEELAGRLAAASSGLGEFMDGLRRELSAEPEAAAAVAVPAGKASAQPRPARDSALPSPVVVRDSLEWEPGQRGGELSLKLVFQELRLGDPARRELLEELSGALRRLLYDRQLVGYSKTSLVFGPDRSLGELLEALRPLFLSEAMLGLLRELHLVTGEETGSLELASNPDRELVFRVAG